MASEDYELIDSGEGRKLERFGAYVLSRPAPQALWRRRERDSVWKRAHGTYERSTGGGGRWEDGSALPESWTVALDGLRFIVRPTGFGHLGLFPEQLENWRFIERRLRAAGGGQVMNLFGYTGAATLFAARAGASVCHLDASRGVVDWARENLEQNGMGASSVRWMVEDALKYLRREARRGRRYEGVILDPPAFGRGNKGEVWKIEDDLAELLLAARELLSERPNFVLISTYSPRFTPLTLANAVADAFEGLPGRIEALEMTIPERGGARVLPNGVTVRFLMDSGERGKA